MPNIMTVECNQSQQNHRHYTDVFFSKIVPLAIGFGCDIKILQYKRIGQLHSWRVESPAVRVIIIANSLVKQMLTHIKLPQHHKSPSKVSVIFRGSSSLCHYDVGFITSWGSCCLAWGAGVQLNNLILVLSIPPPSSWSLHECPVCLSSTLAVKASTFIWGLFYTSVPSVLALPFSETDLSV